MLAASQDGCLSNCRFFPTRDQEGPCIQPSGVSVPFYIHRSRGIIMLLKVNSRPDISRQRREVLHLRWRPESGVRENRMSLYRCGPSSDSPGAKTVQGGNHDKTPGPGYPEHLGDSARGIFIKELDGSNRHSFVEGIRGEWEPEHIALDHVERAPG